MHRNPSQRTPLMLIWLALIWLALIWVIACAGCGGSTAALYRGPPLDKPVYRVGAADVLSIQVKNGPDYSTPRAMVRPDGALTVPLIGDVRVRGRTIDSVQQAIVRRLAKQLDHPIVTVSLVELRSYEFFVLGRVRSPNRYTADRLVTVMQALAMAGGLDPFAEPDEIVILHEFEDGQRRIPFHYTKVLDGTRIVENIYLSTGDTIVVP